MLKNVKLYEDELIRLAYEHQYNLIPIVINQDLY